MGQSRSRYHDLTDIVPNNVLVTVFTFLTLYEKLLVPRVCKRWYMLMKERKPWQCIDFWEKGPSINHEPWLFPAEEDAILNLIKTHAGSSLLQVHLRYISPKILIFLQENCPNLRVFSFLPRTSNSIDELYSYKPLLCDERVCRSFSDLFIIPTTVTECRLNFLANYNIPKNVSISGNTHSYETAIKSLLHVSEEQQSEGTAKTISKCAQLRYLSLYSYKLTLPGVQILTKSIRDLRELCLVDAKVIDSNDEHEIFHLLIDNLKNVQIFKFRGYGNVDFILEEIVGWTYLKELWLGNLKYTEEVFIEMTSNIPQLKILGIDIIITDAILSAISSNLPNLTELSLVGGEYSDKGLGSLLNLANLQRLYVSDYHIEKGPEFSLQTVYWVIKGLPLIEEVTVSCQRIKKRYSGEVLPRMNNKPNLQIHIDYY